MSASATFTPSKPSILQSSAATAQEGSTMSLSMNMSKAKSKRTTETRNEAGDRNSTTVSGVFHEDIVRETWEDFGDYIWLTTKVRCGSPVSGQTEDNFGKLLARLVAGDAEFNRALMPFLLKESTLNAMVEHCRKTLPSYAHFNMWAAELRKDLDTRIRIERLPPAKHGGEDRYRLVMVIDGSLCGGADAQMLRSELPYIARWAAIEINRIAASTAQTWEDSTYATAS